MGALSSTADERHDEQDQTGKKTPSAGPGKLITPTTPWLGLAFGASSPHRSTVVLFRKPLTRREDLSVHHQLEAQRAFLLRFLCTQ
ncbi:hypothetical protein AFLA_010738 [Aspergillus flavus NRRL3357]|nr:hypothetical protein AFLA_010738 [Aspergillus flavus NRRL3357]